jgi:hypothetical protein
MIYDASRSFLVVSLSLLLLSTRRYSIAQSHLSMSVEKSALVSLLAFSFFFFSFLICFIHSKNTDRERSRKKVRVRDEQREKSICQVNLSFVTVVSCIRVIERETECGKECMKERDPTRQ